MQVFPVAGGARFSSDFADPRSGGRTHEGNDLFAPEGTPLLAVDAGEVRYGTDVLGGNVVNLHADDGTLYYYAHLSAFEDGSPGSRRSVRAGDVVGYLGKTGNAATTEPHLHFEIHPCGTHTCATDPFRALRAAPTADAPTKSRSLLGPVLLAAAVGLGAWAWMNPKQARSLTRRLSG